MHRDIALLFFFCASFVLAPLPASAAPITVPTGLNPGDFYRLAFVTSVKTDATSSNFHDYDAFATTVANSVPALQALGVPWYGVVSTPNALPARDNTGTNPLYYFDITPIYTTGDTRIATSYADLWDGTIENPIEFTEQGNLSHNLVWTGSDEFGYGSPGRELGALAANILGNSSSQSSTWMFAASTGRSQMFPIYAMSAAIMVPTPEPSALVLACLAVAGLAVASLRQRRKSKVFGCRVRSALLVLTIAFIGGPTTSHGAMIDTFTDGTVVNTTANPTQFIVQNGLSGVIGTGERLLEWSGIPGPQDLDLNNLVPGSIVLSAGSNSPGFWAFSYGALSPLDVDLTDSGASNAFEVQFAQADSGTLLVEVTDTLNNNDTQTIALPSLPSGGPVFLPFSLFSVLIDFQHIKNVAIEIDSSSVSSYEMQVFDTLSVPEPDSLALAALGLFGGILRWRRRPRRR